METTEGYQRRSARFDSSESREAARRDKKRRPETTRRKKNFKCGEFRYFQEKKKIRAWALIIQKFIGPARV
jgi:hypothetical protein